MLFQVNNSKLSFEPAILGVKAVKAVIAADKNRQKTTAMKELLYVYFSTDYRSPFRNYSDKEKEELIKEDVGLEKEWKPSPQVRRCQDWYMKRQDSIALKSLRSMTASLVTTTQLIGVINDDIEGKLQEYEGGDKENINLSQVIKQTQELLKLSDDLPKVIETIAAVTEKVKLETHGTSTVRGGGSIGEFED